LSNGAIGHWLGFRAAIIFTMAGRRERIVIPIHGNQPLKKGLLRSLMKIAGLQEDDL
jgi:HicA toxin of bacterial toxin-antitoxin,